MPPSQSSRLDYRLFIVRRAGLSRDLPPGHGDHFFGIEALKKRFPNARAVTTVAVLEQMASQFGPEALFQRAFPGQVPDEPISAERLEGGVSSWKERS